MSLPPEYNSLRLQTDRKETKKETRNVGILLIVLVFILFFCFFAALGFSIIYFYFDCNHIDNSNSSPIPFKPVNPQKQEYIWPGNVEKMINDIVDNNMHVTNDDRAVLLKTELMRFNTSDVFYIVVYDGTEGYNNHAFSGVRSQYITVFKPGKCNVVVYRSHFWRSSMAKALPTITHDVENACRKGIIESPDYSDVPKVLIKNFHDTNFLGLIGKEHNVAVRSANSFGAVWGPGYWDTIPVFYRDTKDPTGKQFILIAGYK